MFNGGILAVTGLKLFVQAGIPLIVLVGLALAVGLYLWFSSKHTADKARELAIEKLEDTYYELSHESLAAIPDDELVRAVIANLLGKLDDQLQPDAYAVIPGLSRGRCAVYSVWLVCNELAAKDMGAYLQGYTANFAELAADGLELVGAARCAAVMREALAAAAEMDDDENGRLTDAFRQAAEEERPQELCRDYIRANPDDFVDYAVIDDDADLPPDADDDPDDETGHEMEEPAAD